MTDVYCLWHPVEMACQWICWNFHISFPVRYCWGLVMVFSFFVLNYELQMCGCGTLLVSRKLEMVLHEDAALPSPGIHPKDALPFLRVMCSTMFITALFVMANN